jgi:hypothetical protein
MGEIFSGISAVLSPVYVEPTHRRKMNRLNRKIIWQIVAEKWTTPHFHRPDRPMIFGVV